MDQQQRAYLEQKWERLSSPPPFRCSLGWHKWREHYRWLRNPEPVYCPVLIWFAVLPVGPKIGETHWKLRFEQCKHCGKRRPA